MEGATTVLIVEDDKFLSELISTKLEKEGCEVLLATDGEQGVRMAAEHYPDIVLLDILLPGMNGFDVLKQLKEHADAAVATIPVVILSNFGQEEKVREGLNLGAVDYLVKANFTTGEIVEKIQSVLGTA